MVAAVTIDGAQAYLITSVRQAADNVQVPQEYTLTAVKFPSQGIEAAQTYITTGVRQTATVDAAQAYMIVAGRGRISNVRLRAWTFSMDGHDFYVLRLGDDSTLVYDIYSEQWMDWSDLHHFFWRANVGQNWVGAQRYGPDFGSDVVVGDDTFGLLWLLDPNQPFDQHPDSTYPVQEIYFPRIVMGQMPFRGREVMPCYAAFITSDMGQPAYDGAGVTLLTSDDAGQTYDDMGLITVTPGLYEPELTWTSLGQMTAPGRLFKITDDGAIARIDGLELDLDGAKDDAG